MEYIKPEKTDYIENCGDILACKYYHRLTKPEGQEAFGDCGSEKIDNKNWDVFHVYFETKDAYYGTPMLGMGLVDCMILKTDTRPFLESELNYNVEMVGMHTLKTIKTSNVKIDPVTEKFL